MAVEALDHRPVGEEPDLMVEFRHVGPMCIISLCGELHAGSIAALEYQVDRLGRTSCQRVVLDLSDVSGVDTVGANVLTGLRHYVQARGGHLTVIGARPAVRATLAAAEAQSA